MDTAYWDGLLGWLRDSALARGTVSESDIDLLYRTDDVDDAVKTVVEWRREGRSTPESRPPAS
jgi:predicted Rossmann-fold nucleotide-binding protein